MPDWDRRGKYPFLISLFFLTAVWAQSALPSEDLPLRTLNIRVAVDGNLMTGDDLRAEIGRVLRDAFFAFKTRFGIQIRIKEMTSWDPDPDSDSPNALLRSLENRVPHKGSDIVLGVASPQYHMGDRQGVSCSCLNYILVRYLASRKNLEFVIQHEICHLFGAVDLREKGSIMSGQGLGYGFDGFTSQVVLLNKNRPFYPASPVFAAEKRDEAISLFAGRTASNPGEEQLYAMLALLYFEKGDYASASEHCASCLAINPESSSANATLGHIHLAQRNMDGAIADYRKALALQPGFSIPHYNLGVALFEKGETGQAIAEFQEAIRAKPDYAEAYANMASAYIKEGEYDLSIQASRTALELTAHLPEIMYVLALGLMLKWEALRYSDRDAPAEILEEAISRCQKSISLKPDAPETHNLLGTAYDYAGKPDLAEAEFLTAVGLKPELTTAHFNLALMYFKKKQYEKSAHHLGRILEINPNAGLGLKIMAAVFEKTRKYKVLKVK